MVVGTRVPCWMTELCSLGVTITLGSWATAHSRELLAMGNMRRFGTTGWSQATLPFGPMLQKFPQDITTIVSCLKIALSSRPDLVFVNPQLGCSI